MKVSHIIILSLGINAALAATVIRQKTAAAPTNESQTTATNLDQAEKKLIKEGKTLAAPVIVDVPGEPFNWRKIESEDYHKYVANLRAIHCPEETIQDIIYRDVNKLYAEKQKALSREQRMTKDYWQTETYTYNGEYSRKSRQLAEEKRLLLIDLLGVDIDKLRRERQGLPDYEALRYPFLTEEKRKQAQDIWLRFQDLEQEIHTKYRNYFGEERNAELQAINKQREAELAKLLTPYELEEYKLRQSSTAQQLRWSMQAFEATEQEFRAIFRVEDNWASTHGQLAAGPDTDDPVAMKKYQDEQKQKEDLMKSALGEQRFKEYSRAKDYEYQQLYRLVQSSDLPKETASKVYDVKEAAQSQVNKVRMDSSLSSEQRQQALADIRAATVQAVQTSLGEKNYKKYESSGGWWIRNLAPEVRSSTSTRSITR